MHAVVCTLNSGMLLHSAVEVVVIIGVSVAADGRLTHSQGVLSRHSAAV